MSEHLSTNPSFNKEDKYLQLLPQLKALLEPETDIIANLANLSAALKQAFNFWWVGFYLVKDQQLILGPFQGPVACTRIPFHKGVCGHAYTIATTTIVPDVSKFPGHIACSSITQSEIVIPILKNNVVIGVLDIDSEHLNYFDTIDKIYLEKILNLLTF